MDHLYSHCLTGEVPPGCGLGISVQELVLEALRKDGIFSSGSNCRGNDQTKCVLYHTGRRKVDHSLRVLLRNRSLHQQ